MVAAFQAIERVEAGLLTPAHRNEQANEVDNHGEQQRVTGYMTSVRDDWTSFVSLEEEMAVAETAAAQVSGTSAEGRDVGGCDGAGIGSGAATLRCGRGAIGRTLGVLARLGEDLDQMVRLRGHVEHQVKCGGEKVSRGVCDSRILWNKAIDL